jgi:hypothetical protein
MSGRRRRIRVIALAVTVLLVGAVGAFATATPAGAFTVCLTIEGTAGEAHAGGGAVLVTLWPSELPPGMPPIPETQLLTEANYAKRSDPPTGGRFGQAIGYNTYGSDCGVQASQLVVGMHGAVRLIPGVPDELSTTESTLLQPATPAGAQGPIADDFGAAVLVIYDDLWVGAPDATVDGQVGAGAIYHYVLDPTGVTPPRLVQIVTQNSPNVSGEAEAGDHFGAVLEEFDPSNYDQEPPEVEVGIPSEDVGDTVDAGMVEDLVTDQTTGLVSGSALITQDSPGIGGTAGAGNLFGAALSYDAVGAPGTAVADAKRAGAVVVLPRTHSNSLNTAHPGYYYTQDTAGVPGVSETGDRFGAALATVLDDYGCWPFTLYAGAPGESIGTVVGAGSVTALASPNGGGPGPVGDGCSRDQAPYNSTVFAGSHMSGTPQRNAHVGTAMAAEGGNPDAENEYRENLEIGAPGQDANGHVDCGEVYMLDKNPNSRTSFAGTVAGGHLGFTLGRVER